MILDTSTVEQAHLKAGKLIWNPLTRQASLRGAIVKLPRRSEECLALLMEARGELVAKEELQQRIWAGALREDSSLAHAVATLRKALDPAPGGGSYIDTVARHGYRIALPVLELPPEPSSTPKSPHRRFRLLRLAAVAVLILSSLTGAAAWWQRTDRLRQAEAKVTEAFSILRLGRRADGGRARLLIDSALQLSPNLPIAQAALAEITARYGKAPFRPATDLARRALASDPQCGECQAVLGYILMTREWAWEEAGRHLRRAVSREPVQLQWRLWFSQWLSVAGSLTEAEQQARAAIAMDPSHPQAYSLLAGILFLQGRLEEAKESAISSTTLDGHHVPGHQWLERVYMLLNRDQEALNHRLSALLAWDTADAERTRFHHNQLVARFAQAGRPALVSAYLAEVSEPPALDVNRYQRAFYRAWISDDEGALDELTAGAESKPYFMIYTPRDPAFARLRTNPRFTEVVRKLGLLASLPKS